MASRFLSGRRRSGGTSSADLLAEWAIGLSPSAADRALAERALRDTLAVIYAARDHPLCSLFVQLGGAGRLAALAHVLDFDDLHLPSTTHISAICVPVALADRSACAGSYLAGAGVMARLGAALGWRHYAAGWHATCTAGAPAAAVAAAVARGLNAKQTATAIALAVPAGGGVQRAFGTASKALQVGFAADAGVRAARLADAGATADPRALDDWLELVNGDPRVIDTTQAEAVPGGLAIKLYPCCYALQRPISAIVELEREVGLDVERIRAIKLTTPRSALKPLIHRRPKTGLEGKFSLEYAVATALIDGRPNQQSFTDRAVERPAAQRLLELVEVIPTDGEGGLLDGDVTVQIRLADGKAINASLTLPPGAPARPPSDDELRQKLWACAGSAADKLAAITWESAHAVVP
jgi:2-methylcitrate dehydratase PrpD